MIPTLSILIPTVNGREEKLEKLLHILEAQQTDDDPDDINDIEIIVDKDNKEVSIGEKRQRLLESAQGEYVVFIDDDDEVSHDYIRQILKNLGADAVGFLIDCFYDGKYTGRAKASKQYLNWADDVDGYRYVRTIYHKTPHKRELALQTGFKDIRFGEDYDYCMRLQPLIKTENFIDKVLYFYRYTSSEDHNKKYGIR
jgi:glycosyltransferase involved in cell wall biosynthesis